MNLTLDFGNSRTKAGVFNADECVFDEAYDNFGAEDLRSLLERFPIDAAIACSVSNAGKDMCGLLKSDIPVFIELTAETPVPLKIEYGTPRTLGMDRVAAAAGAAFLKPGRNLLVIDAGTALTLDIVSGDGAFLGGNISPGASMRFRALHSFTGRLPLAGLEDYRNPVGCDTRSAIAAGVVEGIVNEIEGCYSGLSDKYPGLLVFLTGGDGFYFAKRLKIPIFVSSNLLSLGLNRILNYNICRASASQYL